MFSGSAVCVGAITLPFGRDLRTTATDIEASRVMNVVTLVKLAILFAIAYPFAARVWRNLRRPVGDLSEQERRLVRFWRWQAVGISLAGIVLALWLLLLPTLVPHHVPFWAIYAVVLLGGSGVLIAAHARTLESRASDSLGSQRLRVTISTRYDIAWKAALIGSLVALFSSLSVTSFRSYAWLAHPLLVATYVLIGLALVLAALAGWTGKRR